MNINVTAAVKLNHKTCVMLTEKGNHEFHRYDAEIMGVTITGDFCKTEKAALRNIKEVLKERLS